MHIINSTTESRLPSDTRHCISYSIYSAVLMIRVLDIDTVLMIRVLDIDTVLMIRVLDIDTVLMIRVLDIDHENSVDI
jgi:hypothetical protein